VIHPADEMDRLFNRAKPVVTSRIRALAAAMANRDPVAVSEATQALEDAIAGTMALADIVARRRVIIEVDAMDRDDSIDLSSSIMLAAEDPLRCMDEVPRVPFLAAIRALLRRTPRLAQTADQVVQNYRVGDGFAAVLAATVSVAKRVQKAIADLITKGTTVPDAASVIAETAGWTEAYSETVFRTNLATAYSEGRKEQARTPAAQKVVGAFMVSVTHDDDLRRGRKRDNGENHQAADGLIAATDDPIWSTTSPPYGYQCRCVLILVSRLRLQRQGLIDETGGVIRYHPRGLDWFRRNFRPHPRFAVKSA